LRLPPLWSGHVETGRHHSSSCIIASTATHLTHACLIACESPASSCPCCVLHLPKDKRAPQYPVCRTQAGQQIMTCRYCSTNNSHGRSDVTNKQRPKNACRPCGPCERSFVCNLYLSAHFCPVMGFDRTTLPSPWAIAAVPCLQVHHSWCRPCFSRRRSKPPTRHPLPRQLGPIRRQLWPRHLKAIAECLRTTPLNTIMK